jgi:hypothetical protein
MRDAERVAQFAHQRIVVEILDAPDLRAVAIDGEGQTRALRLAVDQHRAGAAHALLTAEMGPGEMQVAAQEISEMQPGLDLGRDRDTVDGQRDDRHVQ